MNEYDPIYLWRFLLFGYVLTVLLEAPILLFGLASRHSWRTRLISALWLTACTYPIVVLVLPLVVASKFGYGAYLTIAETFAPAAESVLFIFVFDRHASRGDVVRDVATIIAANLCSFGVGWALF